MTIAATASDNKTKVDEKAAVVKADAEGETEKNKEEEESKKADADAGEKLDTILKHVDSMRMRMDAIEEREKMRGDSARGDAGKNGDEQGDDKDKVAADKARKDAAVRRDEPSEREEMAERIKAKEAEKKKADAQAERDEQIADRLRLVEARLPKPFTDADFASMADAQHRADAVFAEFGERAPRFLDGETLTDYRRRLAGKLKGHSPAWKDVDLAKIADDNAFGIVEKQVYADAQRVARNPTDLPDGELRMITRRDPETDRLINTFVGKKTFIAGMNAPAKGVRIGMRRDLIG